MNNQNIREVLNQSLKMSKQNRSVPEVDQKEKHPNNFKKRSRKPKIRTEEERKETRRPGRPRKYPDGAKGKPLDPKYLKEY